MNTTIPLPLRPLGKSGLLFSAAGMGTVKFGRNQGMKYPQQYDLPDDKTILNLLAIAREHGMNWLDTAPAYGTSEERLGKLTRTNDWLIASKVGEEFHDGHSHFDFSAKHTRHSLLRSLKRLNRETLDLVMIHSNGEDLAIIEHSDALAELHKAREEGLIRALGMSCKTPAGALAALPYVDALMLTLNPEHTDDIPAIAEAAQQGVGVVIKKGFGSGHLLEKFSPTELSRFLFQHPITSVVIGTLNPTHLGENCHSLAEVADAHPL